MRRSFRYPNLPMLNVPCNTFHNAVRFDIHTLSPKPGASRPYIYNNPFVIQIPQKSSLPRAHSEMG